MWHLVAAVYHLVRPPYGQCTNSVKRCERWTFPRRQTSSPGTECWHSQWSATSAPVIKQQRQHHRQRQHLGRWRGHGRQGGHGQRRHCRRQRWWFRRWQWHHRWWWRCRRQLRQWRHRRRLRQHLLWLWWYGGPRRRSSSGWWSWLHQAHHTYICGRGQQYLRDKFPCTRIYWQFPQLLPTCSYRTATGEKAKKPQPVSHPVAKMWYRKEMKFVGDFTNWNTFETKFAIKLTPGARGIQAETLYIKDSELCRKFIYRCCLYQYKVSQQKRQTIAQVFFACNTWCLRHLPDSQGEDQENHRHRVAEGMHRPRHLRHGGEDARGSQKVIRRQAIWGNL